MHYYNQLLVITLEEIQKQENNDKNKFITFAYDNKTDTYLEFKNYKY